MASSALATQPSQPCMDRLDAARALLGVSPPQEQFETPSVDATAAGTDSDDAMIVDAMTAPSCEDSSTRDEARSLKVAAGGGLVALATLASGEPSRSMFPIPGSVSSLSSPASSDDDAEAMPPPPPRPRSVSNPEGMDKWDKYSRSRNSRRDFVLPSAILEEELAVASAALKAKEESVQMSSLPLKKRPRKVTVADLLPETSTVVSESTTGTDESAGEESSLGQEDLLRRARSRLLEDLSVGNMGGDKCSIALPHSLTKYKDIYNKNGRIGIYSPAERAAIIARFNSKRSRRVWNKKIRYNCRKNLADRRMRVKGRFVKRSTEQLAKSKIVGPVTVLVGPNERLLSVDPELAQESVPSVDEDMPDVNDPEAGFAPTEDQPYRRLRRHTIT